MEILIFSLVMNMQVEDICLIASSMEQFTPVVNNNGCSETTILKFNLKLVED